MRSAHIVIATVGSLGDLFPFLAIGQELTARGHRVTVATHGIHQAAIEQAGLRFANASGIPEPEDRETFTARAFDRWHWQSAGRPARSRPGECRAWRR
jgi:rhamnosyltransferase subunit B